MATEAERRAVRKYQAKCKEVRIKYTEKEISEYNRLQEYLSENNIKVTEYLKNLIKADLDKKGYWLPVSRIEGWLMVSLEWLMVIFKKLGMITIVDFWAGMLNSVNSLSIKLFYCNTIWVSNSLELE